MFNIGDKIVYPMHGAGTIDSIEEKDVLGEKQSYYILKMPGEVKVMVPIAKAEQVGVRSIIDKGSADKVFEVLEHDETEMNKNWNKRIRQSIRRGNRTRFPRISRRGSRNRKVHIIASGVPETGGQAEEGALHFR